MDIAKAIVKAERKDIFASLICLDNKGWDTFLYKFALWKQLAINAHAFHLQTHLPLSYYGQLYFDLRAFILSFDGPDSRSVLNALNHLIAFNVPSRVDSYMAPYCGLSLLVMQRNYTELVMSYPHLNFFTTMR